MTQTVTTDTPLSPSAAETLVRLDAASHAGAPAAKLRGPDLDALVERGLASTHFGLAAITQAGADLLAAHRQPDGAYLFDTFRVGPMRAPAAAAK